MKKSIFKVLIATLVVFVLSVSAVAWFLETEDISPDVGGSAIAGYFYAGEGTKTSPYQLKSPKHVYNLAWLQYMGYLNEKDPTTNKINQVYFELIGDIDMDGIILPPIGTTRFPFVGHFDGNSHCIRNLTVSNYLSGEVDELKIVQRPLSVTDIAGNEVSIIGFFGVVGALDDEVAGLIADDSGIEDITEKVNAVHDLFLENITVRTETQSSLIGLVAGYANGSILNVGVAGNSGIQLGTQTQPLQMGATEEELIYAASYYSLIGQYNATNIIWKDAPTGGSGSDDEEEPAPGAGWGSTINMIELRKRVTYITAAVGAVGSGQNYQVNGYDYHGWFSSKSPYNITYTYRNNRAVFLSGTIMPLSIDQSIFAPGNESNSGSYPYYLKYYDEHKEDNKEPVISSNSGYLVGGGEKTSNSNDTSFIKFWPEIPLGHATSGDGVYKSLSVTKVAGGAFPANNESFAMHMLTIGTDGKTYVIRDKYNTSKTNTYFAANSSNYTFLDYNSSTLNFKKYIVEDESGVDTGVRTSFVNSNTGEKLIQGISFSSAINISESGDYSAMSTRYADSVTLLNKQLSNYEMIEGAINFSLQEAGTTTTVMGTFDETFNGLFSILKVDRGSTNAITSVKIISRIYERNSPAKDQERYVYEYSDGTWSDANKSTGCTIRYDRAEMRTLTVINAIYYFEIPLNAGDYAIGATVNDNSTAFLLYLDIGANGDMAPGEDDDEGEDEVVSAHQIEGVTFVDSAAITAKSTEGYSVITFEVAIQSSAYGQNHSGLTVVYNRTSKTAMTVTETDPKNVFDITTIKDDDALSVSGVSPPSG